MIDKAGITQPLKIAEPAVTPKATITRDGSLNQNKQAITTHISGMLEPIAFTVAPLTPGGKLRPKYPAACSNVSHANLSK